MKKMIMEVSHRSNLSIHPGATKMYYDLKKLFWWSGLKRDVAQFVYACLICQKSKVDCNIPLVSTGIYSSNACRGIDAHERLSNEEYDHVVTIKHTFNYRYQIMHV